MNRKRGIGKEVAAAVGILSALLLSVSLVSCGKKGPPTLKSYVKPPAPVLVSALHREKEIMLSWAFPKDKEESTEGFFVLRAAGAGYEKVGFAEAAERSFADRDFSTGTEYSYKVVAKNMRGVLSDDSNIFTVKPLNVPASPENVSFRVSDDSIVLNWKDEGDGVYYNVYKSLKEGDCGISPVNRSPLKENSFTDALDVTRPVYYTVRALLGSAARDEGLPSDEVAVDPRALVPSEPKNLRYFAAADRVYLYWEGTRESWVKEYRVYRRIGSEKFRLVGETQIPVFVDVEPPLSPRDYRVTAVGPEKEGAGIEVKGVLFVQSE